MLKLEMVPMVFYCFTNIIILRYLLSYYKLYIVVNPMNCYYIHLYIQMEDTYSYLHISLYITFWLVVSTPLKNSQLGWLFPYILENNTCSKPPTSISLYITYSYNCWWVSGSSSQGCLPQCTRRSASPARHFSSKDVGKLGTQHRTYVIYN